MYLDLWPWTNSFIHALNSLGIDCKELPGRSEDDD